MSDYIIKYYFDEKTELIPVKEYINSLDARTKSKVMKYIELLRIRGGYLDEPYARHIIGKIRELRVDFAHGRHRFFYFVFINKQIVFLHAFQKKSAKTPKREILIAQNNLQAVENNSELYG